MVGKCSGEIVMNFEYRLFDRFWSMLSILARLSIFYLIGDAVRPKM